MSDRRFVALDRDGTVIVERHYLSNPEQVELLSGAGAGLKRLRELGLGLVLLTNQSAISRGMFDHDRLGLIHERLAELLAAHGVRFDGIYYCPHRPDENCACRKPEPEMLRRAADELKFDPTLSFVIGDKPCDIDLGRASGATTVLVRTGYGAEVERTQAAVPDYIVNDLSEAALLIERLISTDQDRRAQG